jgi:hypothetical protein
MKRTVAFFVIVMLCSTANIQVFSQKNKDFNNKKIPVIKNQPPIIKHETPGNVPSDVKLKSAAAYSDGNGVFIKWQTEYENKNLGFYLYRVGANGTELVSEGVVAGGRSTSSEEVVYDGIYSYFDENGDSASSYVIESLQMNGNRKVLGQVSTKSVNDLSSLAGASSRELKKRRDETVVAKAGESDVILPKDLQEEYEANLVPPDITMQRWVASQPGVKIGVKKEGIYRVSRTELQNAGFDVNAPGNLWQLYVDGKQQSINVGAGDSYIEFYGQGIDTPESETKVYYLIVGAQNGLRMGTTLVRPLSGNILGTSYYQTFVRKDRILYLSPDILNGDAENFFGNVAIIGSSSPTPPIASFTFSLTGVDFNSPNSVFEVTAQGITGTPHQMVATINNEPLGAINGNGFTSLTGSFQIPTSSLREGTNTLRIQSFLAGANGVLDSIRVSYMRKYEAIQNRLSFYTNNYRQTTISGFTSSNIRVFDLTFPDNPTILTGLTVANTAGNHRVTIPSNRGRAAFAVEDSAISSVASIIPNNPSSLATTAHNADLIILSHSSWLTQANDWANYRRGQGLAVDVIDIEDVYDEFSYGSLNSAGITEFFSYAKNNWQTPPKYILLLGDFSYDPRNYENRAFQNFIPTKRVDTIYEETGSDEALCDFNNDGLAEIAVGRIPARSAAQVTQLLNKTMTFEAGLATAYSRGALFASDLPVGYDFEALNQRVSEQLPAGIPKFFLARSAPDSYNLLVANLNQGRYLVNYSGHGAAGSWSQEWLNLASAGGLTNAPNYTLFNMLTCANGYFLRTDFDSLAEGLLKAPNGGAVAVWASTGKTTPDVQEVLATRFYNQLNLGTMTRYGDLVQDAKQNVIGGRDVRLSWALLGDPTLKIKP